MTAIVTDESIRILLGGSCETPLSGIKETPAVWDLGGLRIKRRYPEWVAGFARDLYPQSHFYKRWFALPTTAQRGWAVIFQVRPVAEAAPDQKVEYLAGWVQPERADEADRWIEFLNSEIRKRLQEKAASKPRNEMTDDLRSKNPDDTDPEKPPR